MTRRYIISLKRNAGGNKVKTFKSVSEWKTFVKPALESKANEFRLLGYTQVTDEDIWGCLEHKIWKGDPKKRLYEVVGDIFHLGSNIYMSYLTLNAQQDNDLMNSITALMGENRKN